MPSLINVIFNFKGSLRSLSKNTDYSAVSASNVLSPMTAIFRINFWETFSSVYRIALTSEAIAFLAHDVSPIAAYVLESDRGILDGIEPQNYVVLFQFRGDADSNVFQRQWVTEGWGELDFVQRVQRFRSIVSHAITPDVLCDFSDATPGISFWSCEFQSGAEEVLALIFAYYYYGWILSLRAERDLALVRTNADISDFKPLSGFVIRSRIRLINIHRRFLSVDRSNQKFYKSCCDQLQKRYRIEEKFNRLLAIHGELEHHFRNLATAKGIERTAAFVATLQFLTIFTVPLAIIGVILEINLGTDVFEHPAMVLRDSVLWIILLIGIIPPLALLVFAKLFDKILVWYQSKSA